MISCQTEIEQYIAIPSFQVSPLQTNERSRKNPTRVEKLSSLSFLQVKVRWGSFSLALWRMCAQVPHHCKSKRVLHRRAGVGIYSYTVLLLVYFRLRQVERVVCTPFHFFARGTRNGYERNHKPYCKWICVRYTRTWSTPCATHANEQGNVCLLVRWFVDNTDREDGARQFTLAATKPKVLGINI